MPTANARKGSETERMVAKYLREQGFPKADRRLREGRADDQGDIDGVPYTTIQVKYVAQPRMQSWVTDTLKQRDAAGNPLCLLVVRVKGKAPGQWSAYMPSSYFIASYEGFSGEIRGDSVAETEAWTWVRMDLRMAVFTLKRMTRTYSRSQSSSPTTSTAGTIPEIAGWPSAPSTGKGTPPSPTT